MYYKNLALISLFFLNLNFAFSQTCRFRFDGTVIDLVDKKPLSNANILIVEIDKNLQCDLQGAFIIENICPGKYHLKISHIGCETKTEFVEINKDTTLTLYLDHSLQTLHEIHVQGDLNSVNTLQTKSINKEKILENSQGNLSTLLENIAGVGSIKNGTIAKPVVQGFSGNRLSILNNGVPQNGQQWGTDHAPEIDPLVASKLQVIKGAASLAYSGSNAGNVILIVPANIENDPHIHGSANYFFESNGKGHGLRAEAQQGSTKLAWRMGLTYKNIGDRNTPSYYFKNTGNKEINGDMLLERSKNNKQAQLYFSTFNADLGLLRGSQIGNLEDLNAAFLKTEPFFTEKKFSRNIAAPYQAVSHNLLKASFKNLEINKLHTEAYIAIQSNLRKEYDIRRNLRNTLPSLSILQNSIHGEYKLHLDKGQNLHFSTGIQAKIIDNTNNAETGILPLLPDFRSLEPSVFAVLETAKKNIHYELGMRYDGVFQNIKAISSDLPRRVLNYSKTFNNLSTSAGLHAKINKGLNLEFQTALGNRNPAVNELYSNGLHQGVAGIELGNADLKNEQAFKNTLSIEVNAIKWLNVNISGYYNYIRDYIYLRPGTEKRLTIRGAFPVFRYSQTNASIRGLDADIKIQLSKSLHYNNQLSLIKGTENKRNLVYLPQNRIKNELHYELNSKGLKANVSHAYHLKYTKLDADQDFAEVPPSFGLWALAINKEFAKKGNKIKLSLTVNNLLNTSYRMYLNRLRYYSDDLGRSVVLGVNVGF